jgi:hypothetical protein
VLGIEAARQSIYNELVEVVEFDGTYPVYFLNNLEKYPQLIKI